MLALTGCQSAPPKGLSAEQIDVLKREGFTPTDEGWAYDLSGKVLFGSDLDSLNSQSQAIVERIGKALLGVGIQGVRVDGHADSSGKAAYNQQLSERRAQSVGPKARGRGRYAGAEHPVPRAGQQPAGGEQPHQRRAYREPAGVHCGGFLLTTAYGLSDIPCGNRFTREHRRSRCHAPSCLLRG
ncbi:OmpA/MotB domain-containing protein [Pseudomonas putida S11]|nr:OmpA/MotB domain-containing protein [Pseudomonas putida S11]